MLVGMTKFYASNVMPCGKRQFKKKLIIIVFPMVFHRNYVVVSLFVLSLRFFFERGKLLTAFLPFNLQHYCAVKCIECTYSERQSSTLPARPRPTACIRTSRSEGAVSTRFDRYLQLMQRQRAPVIAPRAQASFEK